MNDHGDDDDDTVQAKKSKPAAVRGRRGFSKKKSADLKINHEILESSAVYSTRVTKCFNDLESHKIDSDLRHALADNITGDIEEDNILCPTKTENPGKVRKRKQKQNPTEVLLVPSDEEENDKNSLNETVESDMNNSAIKSRSPTPPPTPPQQGIALGRKRRVKPNIKKAMASLTKSLSAAESQLKESNQATPGRNVCVIEEDDDITVRVDIMGKINRFLLQVEEPFSKLVNQIAAKEKVDPKNIMFVYNDRTIRPTDNPSTIGFHTVDIIKCHIRTNCNDSFNDSYSFDTEEANLIEIVVQSKESRQKEIIKTHLDRPLRSVMKEYSERVEKDLSCMKFWFDGEIIDGGSTPSNFDMEDGDILDMQID